MPDGPDTGVFLERRNYRRRRLIDGQKLLPFLGAWLFVLPLFWPVEDTGAPRAMSFALHYVFGVWLALIVACAVLILMVRRTATRGAAGAPDPGARGEGEEEVGADEAGAEKPGPP